MTFVPSLQLLHRLCLTNALKSQRKHRPDDPLQGNNVNQQLKFLYFTYIVSYFRIRISYTTYISTLYKSYER